MPYTAPSLGGGERERVKARPIFAGVVAVVAGLAGTPALAGDPDFLAFSAGGFDIDDDRTTAQFRVEYRSDFRRFYVAPMLGLMVNADGGVYGYGGLYLDLYFGRRWVVTPNLAVGGYSRGSSKELGNTVEFRSAIEFAYRFDNRARLGIAVDHISNASLGSDNPGTESVVLTLSVPMSILF